MKKNIKEFLSSEKTKKILVFTLLGLLFAGSMYLIFAPSAKEEETVTEGGGINTTIPQAMEDNMTDDKLKAYEFAPEEKMRKGTGQSRLFPSYM